MQMKTAWMIFLALVVSLSAKANHWTPNPYQFPDNMNVIAVVEVNEVEQTNTNLEIGAFCSGECRGSEMLTYYPAFDRCMFFLTIYGQYGDQLNFRLYDHATQREYELDCANSISFISNQVLGSLDVPYLISFTGSVFNVRLTVVPEEGGTATGNGVYFPGDQCTLTAMPNSGCRFVAWQEDTIVLSTEMIHSFTVSADHDITAVFEHEGCTITADADPVEGGTVIGAGYYDVGAQCALEAVENPGYAFVNWTEDGIVLAEDPTLSFAVETDRCLVAHFERLVYHVDVEANPEEGGIVEGAGDYPFGDTVSLHATAAPGFFFIHWEEDGVVVSSEADFCFPIDANHSFEALFSMNCHLVEAMSDPVEGGHVSGAGNYIDGTTCTLQAQPRPGYAFLRWTGDGTVLATTPTYSFVVEADRSLVAHFEHVVCHIIVTSEPEIGGSVIGGGDFYYGETCVVEALPAHNYVFDRWKENGGTVSEDPAFSFVVMRSRDLVAHFVYLDGVEEGQDSGYTAYCANRQIIVGNSRGEQFIPMQVVDLQGRCVANNNLSSGLYLFWIDGEALKIIVR